MPRERLSFAGYQAAQSLAALGLPGDRRPSTIVLNPELWAIEGSEMIEVTGQAWDTDNASVNVFVSGPHQWWYVHLMYIQVTTAGATNTVVIPYLLDPVPNRLFFDAEFTLTNALNALWGRFVNRLLPPGWGVGFWRRTSLGAGGVVAVRALVTKVTLRG